jgi:hypothetical protein
VDHGRHQGPGVVLPLIDEDKLTIVLPLKIEPNDSSA